jgi:hypothetical protein
MWRGSDNEMSDSKDLWQGLSAEAQKALRARDYNETDLPRRLETAGVDAADLVAIDRSGPVLKDAWIPGAPRRFW